ncbi:Elongation factor 4 [Seminavis robusta]|uniref:Elongation factor 4 n=1 Tax=Seminavis robusta TaxID=568900 RepID=A0A9N8D9L6_9STRA|nr:Elongation factor 4 [Seminavis robusta]|eukprot:Sro25_g016940.1 Elongation factor 4 (1151) ;mRNA; r:72785-76309
MSKSSVFLPPSQTRIVTIVAHVDHGKTTLADNLVEHNGIISERLAGTIRYLDSLEEERRRGITMRASAIGLKHSYVAPGAKKQQQAPQDMIIHLLDSPGHTDFSSEVTSSLQCCDGALLVVDAVEGMCARTHQVLREAHVNQLVPILVINKVDRLCTDLCLTATEAYLRLRTLIETVNAASSAMLTSSRHHQDDEQPTGEADETEKGKKQEKQQQATQEQKQQEEEDKEELLWTFDPMKGNVVFASALFGWGFTVPSLARTLFRNKILPLKPMVLRQCLFGDFKYRNEKVLVWKADASTDEVPLFAEYALQPIWNMYEGVAAATSALGLQSELFADGRASLLSSSTGPTSTNGSGNNNASDNHKKITSSTPGMDMVIQAMQSGGTGANIPKSADDIQTILSQTGSNTEEAVLRSLLRRYRPLSDVLLDTVAEICPSPIEAASSARPRALAFVAPPEPSEYFLRMRQAALVCDPSSEGPDVAHVCKFMGASRRHVRDPELNNTNNGEEEQDDNVIMGLARVLCGTLRTGSEYFVMGPKHKAGNVPPKRKIRLYLLMGSDLVRVNEVPAGHLCAIHNLEDLQLKTVTLCDEADGMPLQGFDRGIRPLVKVNVEAVDAADTEILERGLLQLSLADAAVEVTATSKGERILACLGEIHLEQSILDLQQVYCRKKDIQLRVSDPIVEFAETTDWMADKQEDNDFQAFFDDQSPRMRQTTIPPYNEEEGLANARHGRARAVVSGRCAAISVRVVPLASSVYKALKQQSLVGCDDCEEELLRLARALQVFDKNENDADTKLTTDSVFSILCDSLCSIDGNGNAMIESRNLSNGKTVKGVVSEANEVYIAKTSDADSDRKERGENDEENEEEEAVEEKHNEDGLVLNQCSDEHDIVRGRIRQCGFYYSPDAAGTTEKSSADAAALQIWKANLSSAVAGFQLAVRAGPVCEEPIRDILVVLEGFEVAVVPKKDADGKNTADFESATSLSSGMIMSAILSGVRCSMLTRPPRLIEGHLSLTMHATLTGLGPLYAILSRRRGKVVKDDMVEGTDLIEITATLPQAEAFGLAPELFKKTSGQVTAPELNFSHFSRLDEDPFWIPATQEEREDFGEIQQNGDVSTGLDNTALNLIRKVRTRKGLLVDSNRTVVAAEKQRTRKR